VGSTPKLTSAVISVAAPDVGFLTIKSVTKGAFAWTTCEYGFSIWEFMTTPALMKFEGFFIVNSNFNLKLIQSEEIRESV